MTIGCELKALDVINDSEALDAMNSFEVRLT